MRPLLNIVLGITLSLTMVSATSAAQMVAIYTGVVTSVTDNSGEFAGGDPTNQAFVAKFVYETAHPSRTTNAGVLDLVNGGFGTMFDSPLLAASLTVAGQTFDLTPNFGAANIFNASYHYSVSHRAEQHDIVNLLASDNVLGFGFEGNAPNYSLDDPFQTTSSLADGGIYSSGSLQLWSYDYKLNKVVRDLYVGLRPDTVSINLFSAVPEPSTWAMMIAGFGLVGGSLRRRNTVAVRPRVVGAL